jgi:hypothetical protein
VSETNDWQRLGLEAPTTDQATIKRAYAAKLKTTRPDDDAAAYQALREAYDRVQQYARWRRERAEGQVAEALAVQVLPAAEVVRTQSGEQMERPTAPPTPVAVANTGGLPGHELRLECTEADSRSYVLTPEALCRQLLEAHADSRNALERHIPTLSRQLHELPLTFQAEASVRLADLVLSTPTLPADVLQLLQSHFSWLDDFRNVRLLGSDRAAALHQALGGLERRVTDPSMLRKYAEALAIHALFGKGRNWRALLVATLMGTHLHRQLDSAGPLMLRRMGIGINSQKHFLDLLNQGQWLRTAGLALLIFLAGWLMTGDVEGAMWGTIGAAGLGLVGLLVLHWFVQVLYAWRGRPFIPARWTLRWRLHRLERWWPWIGLALLAVAAVGVVWASRVDEARWCVASLLIGFVGLQMAAPEAGDQGFVAISTWLYVAAQLLLLKQPAWLVPAALWILAGMHLHLQRIGPPDDVFDGGWFGGVRTALTRLALLTVGLPTLVSWLARRAGYQIVIGALVLAFSPVLMGQRLPLTLTLLVLPGLALGIRLTVQHLAWRLARRLAGCAT